MKTMMSFTYFLILFNIASCVIGISVCPTRTIISTSGRITSPNYPNKYNRHTNCTLTISLPLDTKITFTFNKMDLEGPDATNDHCFDKLTIKGFYTEKEFCGSALPAAYTTKTNVVEVHMESDEAKEATGFDLSFTSKRTTGLPPSISVCNTRTVDAILTGGRVMSPNFPRPYPDDTDCKLTLNIPPNKEAIVVIDIVDIKKNGPKCTSDKLLISNKTATETLCGYGHAQNVTISGDEVSFHFTTLGRNSDDHRGFIGHYTLIDVPGVDQGCTCSMGNSYIKRTLKKNNIVNRVNNDISLQFKTLEPNGMLLYAKGTVRDHILLKLENGAITFEIDLGTGKTTLNVVSQSLNDDNWHTVQITRSSKSVTVLVDGDLTQVSGTTKGAFSQLDLYPSANMFILGGYNGFNFPFKGCAKNFTIDGMKPIEAAKNGVVDYNLFGTLGTC